MESSFPIDFNTDEYASISLMTVAALLAFGTDILVKQIWKKGHPDSQEGFRSTFLYGATHSVAISARVYLGFIITEFALKNIPALASLRLFSSEEGDRMDLGEAAPVVASYLWVGMSTCTIKKILLLQSISGKRLGRVALLDRFLDFVFMVVTFLNIFDVLQVDLSTGMQSVLSMGGVGALVFSLASKDIAEGVVGGLALNAWDAFDVGDIILLGDGTEGIVREVGLIETHIQGYDHTITRIPNGQLTTARVCNLSRVKKSRLAQTIRFKYSDLDKLPALLEDIKLEIQANCNEVITDGSAAFHSVLEKYEADHISGLVVANFNIPLRTKAYIDNRQQFMLAIAQAMKKHDVQFAIPSIEYCGHKESLDSAVKA